MSFLSPLSINVMKRKLRVAMTSQLPSDGIEALLNLGSNGEKYCHRYQVHQTGEHSLLLLELLDLVSVKNKY